VELFISRVFSGVVRGVGVLTERHSLMLDLSRWFGLRTEKRKRLWTVVVRGWWLCSLVSGGVGICCLDNQTSLDCNPFVPPYMSTSAVHL